MEKIPAKRPHRIFAVVKGRLKKKDLRKKGQKKAEMEFEPSEAAACLNTHTTHFVAPFHAQEPVAVPVTKATFYWVDFPCSWKIEKNTLHKLLLQTDNTAHSFILSTALGMQLQWRLGHWSSSEQQCR